jgi:hypothetical protein
LDDAEAALDVREMDDPPGAPRIGLEVVDALDDVREMDDPLEGVRRKACCCAASPDWEVGSGREFCDGSLGAFIIPDESVLRETCLRQSSSLCTSPRNWLAIRNMSKSPVNLDIFVFAC